jgi:hypothetical protein
MRKCPKNNGVMAQNFMNKTMAQKFQSWFRE